MSDPQTDNIVTAVNTALESPSAANFLAEIRQTLADAQTEIDSRCPSCDACGRCCQFDTADHRLYVSTGELAVLLSSSPKITPQKLRCEWQIDHKCTARDNRPLGCRVFFCKSDLTEIYEIFHRKIVDIHKKYSIAYFYAEMTSAASEFRRDFSKK
ncbi:MAG: hypothetical protein PHT84_05930 [Candidatus Pacebacteria bacterium]|nr:hypothetical protein [Candidatus Paceibacterota bacterium]